MHRISRSLRASRDNLGKKKLKMQDSQSLEQAKLFFISGLEKLNRNDLSGAEIDFESSLGFAPNRLSIIVNLSIVLIRANKLKKAEKIIHEGLVYHAKNKDLLFSLVEIYKRIISLNKNYAEVYVNLGNVYRELNMYEESLIAYDNAIKLKPNLAESYSNRGNVLQDLKKYKEALEDYDKAIAIKPEYAECYSNKGNALKKIERYEESINCFNIAISLMVNYADAYSNRGIVFYELKQLDLALIDFDKAITLKSDFAEAHMNRGNVLKELMRFDDALNAYERAISFNPNYAEAYYNRGVSFQDIKNYDKAFNSYDIAISLDQHYADAYLNKSFLSLLIGDLDTGWKLYEWRWKVEEYKKNIKNISQPLWLGDENIHNKTILLHAEQGLGDTIQFCRYVKLVKELGARVLLEVPKPLSGLFNGLEGVDQLIVSGNQLPDFDYHCPLLSLPLVFKTILESIPECPKFNIQKKKISYWENKLGIRKKLRVGLVWNGGFRLKNPSHLWEINERRNLPFDKLNCLKDIDAEFISLQKGEPAETEFRQKIALSWDGPHIKDFVNELADFSDTAALVMNLDLVITVDTSTAHLAATLGIPVWLLNRFDTCWRWLLDIEDSPWYPSIKIYRQPSKGDWDSVIQRVRQDLMEYSNNCKL